MFEHLASSLLTKLLAALPGWLLRRFMKAESLRFSLQIDLRGNAPGHLSDSAAVPELEMYLRITNHSAFPVVLDRLDIQAWFGQPFARVAMIERREIAPHSDVDNLRVNTFLSETQLAFLRQMQGGTWKPELKLQVMGYFSSKLGWTEVNATIERREF